MKLRFIIGNLDLNFIFYKLIKNKIELAMLNFCNIAYYRIMLAKAFRFFDGKVMD